MAIHGKAGAACGEHKKASGVFPLACQHWLTRRQIRESTGPE